MNIDQYDQPSKVPWLEDYSDPVEWIFERSRPELASRIVHKMEGAEVMKMGSASSGKKPKAKAKAKSKAHSSTGGIDSFRLCAEETIQPCTDKSKRAKTFVDVVCGSASYVIHLIDRDFQQAASQGLILGVLGMIHGH